MTLAKDARSRGKNDVVTTDAPEVWFCAAAAVVVDAGLCGVVVVLGV